MTKAELVERVQGSRADLSRRQVADLVDLVFETLVRAIRKDRRFDPIRNVPEFNKLVPPLSGNLMEMPIELPGQNP